jgi:hypothetical protein
VTRTVALALFGTGGFSFSAGTVIITNFALTAHVDICAVGIAAALLLAQLFSHKAFALLRVTGAIMVTWFVIPVKLVFQVVIRPFFDRVGLVL